MNLSVNNESGVTVLSINAEVAAITEAPEFKKTLTDLIQTDGIRKIVVDFKGVEFVDSTFLGALVVGLKKMSEYNGDIKVANLEPPVRVMFELTKLYKVFEVFDTRFEAVENF